MEKDGTFEFKAIEHFDSSTGQFSNISIATRAGKYIDPNPNSKEDSKRLILVSGLTDLHTHVFHGQDLGIHADANLLNQGVSSAVDAGSAGGHLFGAFRELVIENSKIRIKAFLNISSIGTTSVGLQGELVSPNYLDIDLAVNTIREHSDVIIGIKVRASFNVGGDNTDNALAIARQAADKAGVPLMVHLGPAPSDVDRILEMLGPGDILTHCFTGWSGNNIVKDGKPRKSFESALKRGTLIDVGHGAGGFDATVASTILSHGYLPNTISTDLHSGSIDKVLSLPNVMSKFLALGMSLESVLLCTTSNPERIAGFKSHNEKFVVGESASFTIFEIENGHFNFSDVHGHNFDGELRINPVLTLHNGKVVSNKLPGQK